MFLDIEKIYNGITERLSYQEVSEQTSFALDRITKILNNPFLSNVYGSNVEVVFGTEKIDDKDYLYAKIPIDDIYKGMVVSIHKSGFLDGAYIVKDTVADKVIFESESRLGNTEVTKTISWYVMNLPKGLDNIIVDVIDIVRLDMKDIAGLSEITQGSDSKGMKSGSHLTHYITKTLQGYYYQPNNLIWAFENN